MTRFIDLYLNYDEFTELRDWCKKRDERVTKGEKITPVLFPGELADPNFNRDDWNRMIDSKYVSEFKEAKKRKSKFKDLLTVYDYFNSDTSGTGKSPKECEEYLNKVKEDYVKIQDKETWKKNYRAFIVTSSNESLINCLKWNCPIGFIRDVLAKFGVKTRWYHKFCYIK